MARSNEVDAVLFSYAPTAASDSRSVAQAMIADNAIHGRLVMGRPVHDFAGLDLMELAVTLRINGAVVGTGRGGNVDGGFVQGRQA